MSIVQPFGFLGASADAGVGYGNPPWNSNVLFYYNFGAETSWESGSAGSRITDVEGNTDADFQGPDWTYDDGTGTNMGVGSAYQSTKAAPARGIIPDNNIGGPYNGWSGEYLWKSPSSDYFNDNAFSRIREGGFFDTQFESNIQQFASTPPKRFFYEGSSDGERGGPIYYNFDFQPNTWYHLVATMEQDTYTRLYVNGSHVATGTFLFTASTTWDWNVTTASDRYILGSNGNTNWTGYMAAIRWYSEAATDANVLANYNHFANYVTF